MCITSNVLKRMLSFSKFITPPSSPPNTMLKDQRNFALMASTLSAGWRDVQCGDVQCWQLTDMNLACVEKRSNCTTLTRLLSMVVGKWWQTERADIFFFARFLERWLSNPRTYKQNHTPTVVQGGGGMEPLPGDFDMLHYFERIMPLVQTLWSS